MDERQEHGSDRPPSKHYYATDEEILEVLRACGRPDPTDRDRAQFLRVLERLSKRAGAP